MRRWCMSTDGLGDSVATTGQGRVFGWGLPMWPSSICWGLR
jgi:hypothetical protein